MQLAEQSIYDLVVARVLVRCAAELSDEPVSVLERLRSMALEDLRSLAVPVDGVEEGREAALAISKLFEIARRELRPDGEDREPPRITPGIVATNRTA